MQAPTESQVVFRGSLFDVERLTMIDDDGASHEREVVRHPGAVAVVAVADAESGPELVLIRNVRVAVQEALWEVPAGKLEPAEAPATAAARELREETGFSAGRIAPLGRFYTSPGFADELMHVFAATELSAGAPDLDAGEQITVHRVAPQRALEMIGDGTIRDGKTIAALALWLGSTEAARGGGERVS